MLLKKICIASTQGLQGNAIPAGYPEMKLPITVEHVSPFPIGTGTFDGHFRVTLDDTAKPVVPGMACKLTLVAYEKKDAIAIPATAVFENPADGEHNLVYVKSAEGKPQERKSCCRSENRTEMGNRRRTQPG